MKMLVNRATGLVREPLSRPVRYGKTAKDHRTYAWSNRLHNRMMRAQAQNQK